MEKTVPIRTPPSRTTRNAASARRTVRASAQRAQTGSTFPAFPASDRPLIGTYDATPCPRTGCRGPPFPGQAGPYHVPRPAPWRVRCPPRVNLRTWSLTVLRLAPVAAAAVRTVTRPWSRAICRMRSESSGRSPSIRRSRSILSCRCRFWRCSARRRYRSQGAQSGSPVRERGLRPAQGQVVGVPAPFDDTLQGAVGDVGVPGTQQQEGGQYPRQAAVPVLERMDGQEDDDEEGDDQQRMDVGGAPLGFPRPREQLPHQPGRVERRRGLEDDAEARSAGTESLDVVGQPLPGAAMALVLLRVPQQVTVKLSHVVLREVDDVPAREDGVHRLGVAGHLLLAARSERPDLDRGEKLLDLPVAQRRSFDARGRTDALDRRHVPQTGQPLGRQTAEREPRALELVDLGDESEDLRRDPQRRHVRADHPLRHPIPSDTEDAMRNTPTSIRFTIRFRPITHPFAARRGRPAATAQPPSTPRRLRRLCRGARGGWSGVARSGVLADDSRP